MKARSIFACAVVCMTGVTATAPSIAAAQSQYQHRQDTKNQWRNLAYIAGALGLYGLVKHDNTLFFAGLAGALYSAQRYEHDRKSQSNMERLRAQMFSRQSFYRDGHKYVRKTTYKNGQKYYYFAKVF
jgi:hypothetical protein